MSPIAYLCPRCKKRNDKPGMCPKCGASDNQRRHHKSMGHGLKTGHWQTLRAQAIRQAHYRCQHCGIREHIDGPLTVHLPPELKGDHRLATIDNVTVLCRSCHGTEDAPRASR